MQASAIKTRLMNSVRSSTEKELPRAEGKEPVQVVAQIGRGLRHHEADAEAHAGGVDHPDHDAHGGRGRADGQRVFDAGFERVGHFPDRDALLRVQGGDRLRPTIRMMRHGEVKARRPCISR